MMLLCETYTDATNAIKPRGKTGDSTARLELNDHI